MISRRQIISGSAGPIFAIFSPNESVLGADDRSGPLFFDISRGVAMATNFVPKLPTPALIALSFRNGMGYRYINVRINNVNDASIPCENFVNFGPVTQEKTGLICELFV